MDREKTLDLLIVAGQILFFVGSIIFAGYALDTQREIQNYRESLKENGCTAVPGRSQSFDMNTSINDVSSIPSSSTTERGT